MKLDIARYRIYVYNELVGGQGEWISQTLPLEMFFEKTEKRIDKRRKMCFTNDENSLIIKVIQKAYKK